MLHFMLHFWDRRAKCSKKTAFPRGLLHFCLLHFHFCYTFKNQSVASQRNEAQRVKAFCYTTTLCFQLFWVLIFFGSVFSTNRNNTNKTETKKKSPRHSFASEAFFIPMFNLMKETSRRLGLYDKDNPMVSFWQRFCRKYFTIGYTFTAYRIHPKKKELRRNCAGTKKTAIKWRKKLKMNSLNTCGPIQ